MRNNLGVTPFVIPTEEFNLLPDLRGKTVLEFGNKGNGNGVYRSDYMRAGAKSYHCVDLNGRDGAFPIDLRSESAAKQIKDLSGIDSFDVITNFGMSEHIPVQRTFYKCLHNLAHVGTFFVHWTPRARMFEEHGMAGSIFHCEDIFFEVLAKSNNYKVIRPTGKAFYDQIATCVLQMQEKSEFFWGSLFAQMFWYNELWEKSPDAELFSHLREGWFEPID